MKEIHTEIEANASADKVWRLSVAFDISHDQKVTPAGPCVVQQGREAWQLEHQSQTCNAPDALTDFGERYKWEIKDSSASSVFHHIAEHDL